VNGLEAAYLATSSEKSWEPFKADCRCCDVIVPVVICCCLLTIYKDYVKKQRKQHCRVQTRTISCNPPCFAIVILVPVMIAIHIRTS